MGLKSSQYGDKNRSHTPRYFYFDRVTFFSKRPGPVDNYLAAIMAAVKVQFAM